MYNSVVEKATLKAVEPVPTMLDALLDKLDEQASNLWMAVDQLEKCHERIVGGSDTSQAGSVASDAPESREPFVRTAERRVASIQNLTSRLISLAAKFERIA